MVSIQSIMVDVDDYTNRVAEGLRFKRELELGVQTFKQGMAALADVRLKVSVIPSRHFENSLNTTILFDTFNVTDQMQTALDHIVQNLANAKQNLKIDQNILRILKHGLKRAKAREESKAARGGERQEGCAWCAEEEQC